MDARLGLCSIIIPVYNREAEIVETVASCLLQDYPNVEVILINDGSNDNSLAVCENLARDANVLGKTVVVLHQENAGACIARNTGMAVAKGEFLMFLDSDDTIPPHKLSTQIEAMNRINADCCISDFQTIDEQGRLISIYRNDKTPVEFITGLKSPSNSAIVMRRSSLPVGMVWNASLKCMQDFDFMLRYLSGVRTWVYVPQPLYNYRLHSAPRISDSYRNGLPYAEMFWSMRRHLREHPPSRLSSSILMTRFGGALIRSFLKDEASRMLPKAAKSLLKKIGLK